jgi:hypothetical protein
MSKQKTVSAIVRGPRPYFGTDGKLYAPGQIAPNVPAEFVSTDDATEEEVEVETKKGDLRTKTIERRVKFRPLDGAAAITEPQDTAGVVTGNPDRLNVTDFLKGSTEGIVAAIGNGTVDDQLPAIEQAEIARKGVTRKAITEAISARLGALHR